MSQSINRRNFLELLAAAGAAHAAAGPPGGRVLTIREDFEDNGFAEMGTLRILDTHKYTHKYIAGFRAGLTPIIEAPPTAFHIQVKRFLAPAPIQLAARWVPCERVAGSLGNAPKYVGSGFKQVGSVSNP